MISSTKKTGTAALLFASAEKMGLNPAWITPNGLIVVKTCNGERYLNYEMSSLNSHVSVGLARDKYKTRLILDRHSLPNIPYSRPTSYEQAEAFLEIHKKIIVKPLRGSGSADIHIVCSSEELAELDIKNRILEKYIAGKEVRYLLLNGSVIGVHESKYGTSVDEHRDLERISYDSSLWDSELVEMSIKISNILGLAFSAVDYLIDEDGRRYILEVNSRPGFKWFHSPSEGPAVDVAKLFLEAMLSDNEKTTLALADNVAGSFSSVL